MSISFILIFSISLFITWSLYKYLGRSYALDHPDIRKKHDVSIPQIGGLVFGPLLLLLCWLLGLAPNWYIFGGIVSILLGGADDLRHVPWQIKLTVQLFVAAYVVTIFWDHFEGIIFYNLSFSISQIGLIAIFVIWFVGIYNAVNLLDGLDGLAGGFMLLLCIGLGFSNFGAFSSLNSIFAAILLGFLVFNQRPAKLFMGDAGSLFLGFHCAVLPLLFVESNPVIKSLNMTPFVLLTSYLVADTSRVFFTRLAARKSPMTADTIHFHHLILQQSGSYLFSILSIYVLTIISTIVTIFSFHNGLSTNVMLVHLSLILIFILTPPIQTYVPIFTSAIRPYYLWKKSDQNSDPFLLRTLFAFLLLIGILVSLFDYFDFTTLINLQHGLAIFLILIFIILNNKDKISMYAIQLGLTFLFTEVCWNIEFGILTKLFTALLIVSYVIFTMEKRIGCNISKFESLDLLAILIAFGGMGLSIFGFIVSFWFFLTFISIWVGLSFVLRRMFYLEQ